MIYLDNAATSRRKPQEVIDAVVFAMTSLGNAGRGTTEAALDAAESGIGVVMGMSMPVLSIPATLIGSLALVMVPELAENFYRGAEGRVRKTGAENASESSFPHAEDRVYGSRKYA